MHARSERETGWFALRWQLGRDRARPSGERAWALAEIACACATLATLALTVLVLIASAFMELPPGWVGWPLQLAMAGAVGYGTNFLAVKMLFQPRVPVKAPPLSWVWPQGLIPAKQAELAEVVGHQVATRLLTPARAAHELGALLDGLLADEQQLERLVREVSAAARPALPEVLERVLPSLLAAVEPIVVEGADPRRVRAALLDWLGAWLRDPRARVGLTAFAGEFLRARSGLLLELVKRVLRRYTKNEGVRSAAVSLGLRSSVIDWDDIEQAIADVMVRRAGQEWLADMVRELADAAPEILARTVDAVWLERMVHGVVTLAREQLAQDSKTATRLAERLLEEAQGAEVRGELRRALVPVLRDWVRGGGLTTVLERFDVQAAVAQATRELDVAELEDMANDVGAYHLAAIQVLGYVLGAAAGLLLVAVDVLVRR